MNSESAIPSSGTQLGRRIELVASRFKTRKEAASAAGVSADQLQRYIRGENEPSTSIMARFADAAGVSIEWLASGRGEMMAGPRAALAGLRAFVESGGPGDKAAYAPELLAEFFPVPRFAVRASAGPGAVAEDAEIKDHLMFRVDWLRRELGTDPAKLGCMDLIGDSMEPLIPSGATILFDRAVERITADGIYVVGLEDALLVKRVQRLMDGVVLLSENPRYPPMTLDRDQAARLEVKGRVRWFARVI